MIILKQKSDILGSFVSSLCLIHCIATPFIFVAQTGMNTCCATTPVWWSYIDIFFLVISFFAIYWSTKLTTVKWMKLSLWINWFLLFTVIINEKLALFYLPEVAIYIPALALVILHNYNRKYCTCNVES
ncbi:MerC domain-containing protein [Polaribacter cellanae]|uniref:MerC domain-containing protein n=1 Tax=Polaribacter cellanae TaxID=2818493 RepID=A0A975CQ05_9FLAO|nr:MerC domain-containing protein [Polaribacter cellanae]QTE23553.1 MerC domain-containing protein [Polaribacter cellanae]